MIDFSLTLEYFVEEYLGVIDLAQVTFCFIYMLVDEPMMVVCVYRMSYGQKVGSDWNN